MTRKRRGWDPSSLHPKWCDRQRCEYVSAPEPRALPRHRGSVEQIGDRDRHSGTGMVMTWLMGGRLGESDLVGVYAGSRSCGAGKAELRLVDVWRLARRLDTLLAEAGFTPPAED